jgi:hypothetical protein
LIVSDFLSLKNINNLINGVNKQFFSVLPLKGLLQYGSFPTLNGYYDKNICKDLFNDYTQNINLLQNYGQVEEV